MRLVGECRLSLLNLGLVLALRPLRLWLLMRLSVLLLAQDLQLQEKLLLLEKSRIG